MYNGADSLDRASYAIPGLLILGFAADFNKAVKLTKAK